MSERRDWDETRLSRQSQGETGWKTSLHHTSSLHGRVYLEPLAREADLCGHLLVPLVRSSTVGSLQAFTVAGPKVRNVLPEGTSAKSLTIFCQRLKTWLFIQSYTLTSSEVLNCYPSDHLLTVFNPEVALQLRHFNYWLTDWLTDQWSLRIEGILNFVLTER